MKREGKGGLRRSTQLPVHQFDEDGEFMKHWPSIRAAARHLECDPSNIVKVCKGIRKTCLGYGWQYYHAN